MFYMTLKCLNRVSTKNCNSRLSDVVFFFFLAKKNLSIFYTAKSNVNFFYRKIVVKTYAKPEIRHQPKVIRQYSSATNILFLRISWDDQFWNVYNFASSNKHHFLKIGLFLQNKFFVLIKIALHIKFAISAMYNSSLF